MVKEHDDLPRHIRCCSRLEVASDADIFADGQ